MIIYFRLLLFFKKNFAFKMAASKMVAFDLSHFADFEQVKKILLTLNNNNRFINFFVIA